MLPRILPLEDIEISQEIEKIFKRNSIDVKTNTKINIDDLKQEKIMISIGLEPNLNKKELDNLGIDYDIGIDINEKMQTNIENIYAIGDITNKIMLAHVAYYQAEIAAKNIMGKQAAADYNSIPSCIFTIPEISSVGEKQEEIEKAKEDSEEKKLKTDIKTSKVSFISNGKARAMGFSEGFIKLISKNNRLTGCHIIGSHADDLIHEAALAIKNNLTLQQIKNTIHAHPTLSEIFLDAVEELLKIGVIEIVDIIQ